MQSKAIFEVCKASHLHATREACNQRPSSLHARPRTCMQRAHRRSVSIVISANQPTSGPINLHQYQSTVISANQRAYSRVARPSVDERRSEPGGRLRSNERCRGRRARPMCVASRSPRPQPRPLLRSPPRPPSPRHRDNTPVGHPTGAGQSVSDSAHQSPSGLIRGNQGSSEAIISPCFSIRAHQRQSGLIRGHHLTLLSIDSSSSLSAGETNAELRCECAVVGDWGGAVVGDGGGGVLHGTGPGIASPAL